MFIIIIIITHQFVTSTIPVYSEARLFARQMRGKIVQIIRACELSEPILRYIFINGRELCPEKVRELSVGMLYFKILHIVYSDNL